MIILNFRLFHKNSEIFQLNPKMIMVPPLPLPFLKCLYVPENEKNENL